MLIPKMSFLIKPQSWTWLNQGAQQIGFLSSSTFHVMKAESSFLNAVIL
jgi:hypothetical protein